MSDAEILARVQARAEANLYWRHLGVSVVDAKPGWVRLRVPVRDVLKNAEGAPVHGGVYSALVDMAVGGALSTLHESSACGVGQTSLDLNVSFLAAGGEAAALQVVARTRLFTLAWPVLRAGLDAACSVSDRAAATAAADLARLGVPAGPCGAAALAAARVVLTDRHRAGQLGVSDKSVVVLLSTEGRAANPYREENLHE